MAAFLLLYILAAIALAVFSLNYLVMAGLYLLRPDKPHAHPLPDQLPRVTVQLPILNELYVVERLINAAALLDWPHNRLQIQVLDDSDDETTQIAQKRVEYLQRQGIAISLIRRRDRSGFKAGALAKGLEQATGEFIAIFDADFVPPPDFLKQTIPHLLARPEVGLVQTRWGHLNTQYSPLTRAQAIALDGHFVVEQQARSAYGLFMNFNGTAGVWRRTCIDQAGGWHDDTLTEDLDLSYRAQLAGWKFLFLPDVVCPAELPPQIHAFKRQQFRWAKGSTQCLIKLAPRVLTTPGLSLFQRVEGILHMSGYLMNPLMLILLLTTVPLIATDTQFPPIMLYFTLSILGPIGVYALSQRALYPDAGIRMLYFPVLMLLGTGLALSDSMAAFEAMIRKGSSFRRTPKFSVEQEQDTWDEKRYRLSLGPEIIAETILALYALLGIAIAWEHHSYWAIPFLALYACGFAFVVALGLWHSRPISRRRRELASASE
ncbi:MAG: cellulose synthase family protein [Anaerolineae bacterium]